MSLPEAEVFVDVLFPTKTKSRNVVTKRQNWRKWKRHVRPASTSGTEAQR
ncbi:hypothetical protein SAMN02910291_02955 [Desulfovibrio desulfuricans]|uniref:Uncharacterized protein n=1 Tax=Desulfovibrio desulfuricans TaxID=876 RepID=A0AA94HVN5_DESDE|nr:hypothetical protein SAMN02910291_02955 [Desulfovibrio desulfuricans]